ncbi:DgyrCDS2387 [Dimorphilus gyrociliatus]|uniref:DgyrCDS2387 n=1 Tax=Dimorphilus gyrociliatus TaxID=2664684 RepID=A0A7I8VAB3_9ANNE|nr:DgyrCDS2387 [Dimorphilus gyrociliatus]
MSSTDQIVTAESITCLSLVDSYTRKTDTNRSASVWIGTSLGSVLVLTLSPPTGGGAGDEDITLMPSPSGTIFRLKGALICISFYDVLTVPVCSNDNSVENSQTTPPGPTSTTSRQRIQRQQSVSSSRAKISPTTSQEQSNDKQLVILCSEKQARVVSLPSHQVVHKAKLTDSYVVVRANVIQIKETLCLVAYVSNGRIMILSIPSLRPLVDFDYITPQLPEQFASTFCFSTGGHAAHMCSPSELQKVTLCSQSEQFTESLCDLYVNKEAPVERKPTLWSSLIRKPVKVDRQELFGNCSKSTSRSVAHLVKGNKLSAEKGRADQATSEIQKAKMAALERGEKLGKLEENTAQMMDAARNYAENAHNLAKQMEKRKWYQL